MRRKKIISILIIVNIILIGLIYNLIIRLNLNNSKQTLKEMSETTQVSNLNSSIDKLNTEHDEYKRYIENSKAQIAQALRNQGVQTENTASFETITGNISKVLQARTKNATATADNITEGKTAYVNGKLITGTGRDNGYNGIDISCIATSQTNSITCPEEIGLGLFFICSDSKQSVTKLKSVTISSGSGNLTELTNNVSSNSEYGHYMVLSIYKLENVSANSIITIAGDYFYSKNIQIIKLPNSITNISVINTNASKSNFSELEATSKINKGIIFAGKGSEQTGEIAYIAGTCGKVTMINKLSGVVGDYACYSTSAIATIEKIETGTKFYAAAIFPRAAGLQILSFD